jgi:hypothetical protein
MAPSDRIGGQAHANLRSRPELSLCEIAALSHLCGPARDDAQTGHTPANPSGRYNRFMC